MGHIDRVAGHPYGMVCTLMTVSVELVNTVAARRCPRLFQKHRPSASLGISSVCPPRFARLRLPQYERVQTRSLNEMEMQFWPDLKGDQKQAFSELVARLHELRIEELRKMPTIPSSSPRNSKGALCEEAKGKLSRPRTTRQITLPGANLGLDR